jgi:hypothetical protein
MKPSHWYVLINLDTVSIFMIAVEVTPHKIEIFRKITSEFILGIRKEQ